jgi:hypothetical protein
VTTPDRPVLRVVRGDATAEELAALAAIVAGASSETEELAAAPVRGRWSDPSHAMRRYWPMGQGGWRSAR